MAVFKVLSDIDSSALDEANSGSYSDFVPFLSALATRFHAAKVLADTMGEAIGEIVEKSITLGIARKDVRHRLPDNAKPSETVNRSKDVEEAELLDCVAKMVDLRLSADRSK